MMKSMFIMSRGQNIEQKLRVSKGNNPFLSLYPIFRRRWCYMDFIFFCFFLLYLLIAWYYGLWRVEILKIKIKTKINVGGVKQQQQKKLFVHKWCTNCYSFLPNCLWSNTKKNFLLMNLKYKIEMLVWVGTREMTFHNF